MKPAVAVTSISPPNDVLRTLATGCRERGMPMVLAGDVASPTDFSLEGCEFLSLEAQRKTGFKLALALPERHYARKNIAYLRAVALNPEYLLETDDDNMPSPAWWRERKQIVRGRAVGGTKWLNVYRFFSDASIWPRGLPLDAVAAPIPEPRTGGEETCPIQQGLVNEDPDVDAICRMTVPIPQRFSFAAREPVIPGEGCWCPFNSQNTVWWPEAFPLLYLPSYCSFRATDIWRGLIAQRIAWGRGWRVAFTNADVTQTRNPHRLMKDFEDELPVYLQTRKVQELLEGLDLSSGEIGSQLASCYEALIAAEILGKNEMELVRAWLDDLPKVQF